MTANEGQILLVDDDPAVGTVLRALLEQAGFGARHVLSAAAAFEALAQHHFDLVLSDVRMPGMDGMALLRELNSKRPEIPVVLLTAHGSVPLAVEAMKAGAADFLLKPFDRQEIIFVLRKALLAARGAAEAGGPAAVASSLIGESSPMGDVRRMIQRAAAGTATVLIRGESGTGKEIVARSIHEESSRRGGSFVKVHCAALPDNLLESELFGYEKGAFTGAASRKPGRIELADRGTLFLDEIGDITPATQVKLLRVLQERSFERLGGQHTLTVDVRFVAATHRDLDAMVDRGEFREDLFYRLNVIPLWLPPLRERPGDTAVLIDHFITLHGQANGKRGITIEGQARRLLLEHSWPGNVRELQNCIERLIVLSEGDTITVADVQRDLARAGARRGLLSPPVVAVPGDGEATLTEQRRKLEAQAISTALTKAGNNRTLAARLLGVSRRTLYTMLEEHNLR